MALGSRLNALTDDRFAEPIQPLLVHGARQLWRRAARRTRAAEEDLDAYVAAWEALCAKRAARKKRKKKAPAAGTLVQVKKEVTPEERAHRKGRAKLRRRADRRRRVEDRLRARTDALQGTLARIRRDKNNCRAALHGGRRLVQAALRAHHGLDLGDAGTAAAKNEGKGEELSLIHI